MNDTAQPRQLPRLVAHQVWSNLPVLLVLDAITTLALLPAALMYVLGAELPSVFVAGACFGSAWAVVVASTDRMARDHAPSIGEALRALRRFGGRGSRLGAYGGAIATVTVATFTLQQENPDQRWLLVPLFVDGTVMTLAVLAGTVAFSLAVTDGLRGQRLLWCSLMMVTRNPWPIAGTLALLVLVGFAVSFVPSLAVLLPAPAALLLSGLVRSARDRTHASVGTR